MLQGTGRKGYCTLYSVAAVCGNDADVPPSVLAVDSLKHSNMPTDLIQGELVRSSDVEESSPAPTAATFKLQLNSALKLAAHHALEAGFLLLAPALTQWDDFHPTAVITRKE